MTRRHRTTARGILLVTAAVGVVAATAGAAPAVPRLIFPVVGPVTYTDDFGAARGQGRHQGNDILAPKRALAVAAEAGRVKLWTSGAGGCMLYLYGASGTTYMYIHLNNDLTRANDNRGKCVPGVAYARGLKTGAAVAAGQTVGYVGDSGDANGIHPHLHFEVHPGNKAAVSPYRYLQQARRLLFSAPLGSPFALTLTGTVAAATATKLVVNVGSLQAWPMNLRQTKLGKLELAVPATATIAPSGVQLLSAYRGQSVVVWTLPAPTTLRAMRGDGGALSAALVQLTP